MTSPMIGANLAELDQLAVELGSAAAALASTERELTSRFGVAWEGPVADRFRSDWSRTHRPAMIAAARGLKDAQATIRRNRDEQAGASGEGAGVAGATGSGSSGFKLPAAILESLGGLDGAPNETVLASFLALAGPGMLKVLGAADLVGGSGELLRNGRVLEKAYAIRHSLGLVGGVPAANWIKVAGGKMPIAGTALAIADVALNWQQHGLYNENTWTAMGLGAGGIAATMVAGPLGGLAFTAGTTIGQLICDHTQVDEALADTSWNLAYGDKQLTVEDPPPDFYRTASREEIHAYTDRASEASQEASRVAERASKPWLFAWDVGRGLFR